MVGASRPRRSLLPRVVPGWESLDDFIPQLLLATFAAYGVGQVLKRNIELAQAREQLVGLAVGAGARAAGPRRARHPRPLADRDHREGRARRPAAGAVRPRRTGRGPSSPRSSAGPPGAGRRPRHGRRASASVSLPGSWRRARAALDAAGIDADLPERRRRGARRGYRELFAWAVREGVTNVVRHSGARRVRRRGSTADRSRCATTAGAPGGGAPAATGWRGCGSGPRPPARGSTTGRAAEGGYLAAGPAA